MYDHPQNDRILLRQDTRRFSRSRWFHPVPFVTKKLNFIPLFAVVSGKLFFSPTFFTSKPPSPQPLHGIRYYEVWWGTQTMIITYSRGETRCRRTEMAPGGAVNFPPMREQADFTDPPPPRHCRPPWYERQPAPNRHRRVWLPGESYTCGCSLTNFI